MHSGRVYRICFVISVHFVMFLEIFLKNGSIDFNQNDSKMQNITSELL